MYTHAHILTLALVGEWLVCHEHLAARLCVRRTSPSCRATYVCMYICMCVYVHTHMCTHKNMHTRIHNSKHVRGSVLCVLQWGTIDVVVTNSIICISRTRSSRTLRTCACSAQKHVLRSTFPSCRTDVSLNVCLISCMYVTYTRTQTHTRADTCTRSCFVQHLLHAVLMYFLICVCTHSHIHSHIHSHVHVYTHLCTHSRIHRRTVTHG